MAKVGFIGLGMMGRPMAGHLIDAGHELSLYNRSPIAPELAARGKVCASAKETAEHADVVIIMVPDTPDVEAVLFGKDGVAEGLKPGKTVVDMSSISPVATKDFARRIEDLGCSYLDAPVSGGEVGARQATLSIMCGGSQETFDRVKPLLDFRRVGAGAGGEHEGLADRLDRQRDDDLVGDFAGLPCAVPADKGDVLAHFLGPVGATPHPCPPRKGDGSRAVATRAFAKRSGRWRRPDLVVGHDFEGAHNPGMIPLRAAMRLAGVEQLLGAGRIGQRDPERAGARQREIEILLVQLDAEARIEGALDHALTVQLEDPRGGEAAHQRLTQLTEEPEEIFRRRSTDMARKRPERSANELRQQQELIHSRRSSCSPKSPSAYGHSGWRGGSKTHRGNSANLTLENLLPSVLI